MYDSTYFCYLFGCIYSINWFIFRSDYQADGSTFDPLGINNQDASMDFGNAWESIKHLVFRRLESSSSTKRDKASSRGVAGNTHNSVLHSLWLFVHLFHVLLFSFFDITSLACTVSYL